MSITRSSIAHASLTLNLTLAAVLGLAALTEAASPRPRAQARPGGSGSAATTNRAPAGESAAAVQSATPPAEGRDTTSTTSDAPAANASAERAPGEKGGLKQSMTVEGEDRIQIQFARPELLLDLDPRSVGGLDPVALQEVIERSGVDLVAPIKGGTTWERSPYTARPWLDRFASGNVARFKPSVEGVARWQLNIADSRGRAVAAFQGAGKPPQELGWDGRAANGTPAPPGFTYSYVFEAWDRAGNKRSFAGEGFQLPPYRLQTSDSLFLLFPGSELAAGGAAPAGALSSSPGPSATASTAAPPAVILEAASRLNQLPGAGRAIRVRVSARSFDQADAMAQSVMRSLQPLLLGDFTRVQRLAQVEPGVPESGVITIVAAR